MTFVNVGIFVGIFIFILIKRKGWILKIFCERISRQSLISTQMIGTNSMAYNFRSKYASDEFVVGSIFHSFLQLLSTNQSANVVEAALHYQRAFLFHFPELVGHAAANAMPNGTLNGKSAINYNF